KLQQTFRPHPKNHEKMNNFYKDGRGLALSHRGEETRFRNEKTPDPSLTQEIANNDTRNVRLMYRECTVSVRGVYRKGTGDLIRSYWRSTTDLLNGCTSGVDQWYSKSRNVVGVEALKNIRILCLGFLCFMLFNLSDAWAQSAESRTAEGQIEIKPLEVGDTIPEELWHLPLRVVNHPDGKDSITLNDYRDKKLIILDFWATWCAPCIKSLDKINEFFDQYEDDLLLAAVTREKYDKVAASMDKHSWSFLSAFEENTLNHYFPHKIIPHHIWINEGKVLAITAPEYAKPTNIEAILAGNPVQFYHKTERLTDIKPSEGAEPNTSFLYFSAFKRFTNQIAARSSVVPRSIKCYNHSLKQLYTRAFSPLLSRQIHDPVERRVDKALFDQVEGRRMVRDGSFENDQK